MQNRGTILLPALLILVAISVSLAFPESGLPRHSRPRRLVGGRPANERDWGFLAKIKYKVDANVLWKTCSISLISSRMMITAAHCLRDINNNTITAKDFVVAIRNSYDSEKTTDYIVSGIESRQSKSNHDGKRYTMFDDDIALIKLRDNPPSSVERIALYNPRRQHKMRNCKVAGWGVREKMVPADIQTRNYELAKNMQEIHVSLLPFRKYCRGVKEKGKHCIGAMTADRYLNGACIGDSGSPYICENETGKFLVGIVVGGSGSCEPMSLIVTDVNSYAAWIWGAKRLLNRKYN